jgi:hypothetical protein
LPEQSPAADEKDGQKFSTKVSLEIQVIESKRAAKGRKDEREQECSEQKYKCAHKYYEASDREHRSDEQELKRCSKIRYAWTNKIAKSQYDCK